MKNRIILYIFIFLSLLPSAYGEPQKLSDKIRFPVTKWTLSNGLTVLVHEDHATPILSYQQWFRVGSSYEKPGRTGFAHFFEHLMFKGTKKYPEGTIDQIVQSSGGNYNAFTTEDYTGYYTTIPSDKLELVTDIESDRMHNLLLTDAVVKSEREVVKEERRMRIENSIFGSLMEQFRSLMYKDSSYHWPVIGYMKDLNETRLEEFQDFYRKYYSPNNAVVVIVGDINTSEVKKLIEKYYGGLAKQELPPFNPIAEPEQKTPRGATIEKDAQAVTMIIAYPGVKIGHPDEQVLDMLTSVLGAGTSSRLYKRLVYKARLATDISASISTDKLSGTIQVIITFQPGADVEKGVALVNQEMENVKHVLISPEEMQKLKNNLMLSQIRGLQTVASKAQLLAFNEIQLGDYRFLFDDLDKYDQVTAEQIKDAANRYFVHSKKNIVQVIPKKQLAEAK